MTNRKIRYWVIPPQADGECVAHMEEVLETYEMPHNPAIPVLGMDGQPVPLLKETRPPIAGTAKHAKRVDSEYERAGTGRRFADSATRREETAAWSSDVTATQRGVDWQMKIDDARMKLKSVYPKIKL